MGNFKDFFNEAKKYEIYHKSYTSAVDEMKKWVKKQGFTFGETQEQEDDQLFNEIGAGPPKPSSGKTNRLHLEIWKKGKKQRKMVHVQVYNTGKSYELNTYIS